MELILELTGQGRTSTEIMSYNIIWPLTKEYDDPSEKVRKISWYWDDTNKGLVTTTDKTVKDGNTDMVDKKGK